MNVLMTPRTVDRVAKAVADGLSHSSISLFPVWDEMNEVTRDSVRSWVRDGLTAIGVEDPS